MEQLDNYLKKLYRLIFFKRKFATKIIAQETHQRYISTKLHIYEVDEDLTKIYIQRENSKKLKTPANFKTKSLLHLK